MDTLKYVGKNLSPTLQSLSGKPVDIDKFRIFEINTFKELFRNQLTAITRHCGGLFQDSIYKTIPSQFGAFDSLLLALNQEKCERLEITSALHNREEFLARVQVRIPVFINADNKLFATTHSADNIYALVSFYIGLCTEFTLISKENKLLENAIHEIDTSGLLGIRCKNNNVNNEIVETVVKENKSSDNAFDPNLVIPEIIKYMRLKPGYKYITGNEKTQLQQFYYSPEGYIFRIEIDGYIATDVYNS